MKVLRIGNAPLSAADDPKLNKPTAIIVGPEVS
jgi:hypothetical protein